MHATSMHISRQGLALVGISLVLVLAVVLFGILPELHSQNELRMRTGELQAELDARKTLGPIREALEREKAQAKRLNSPELAGNTHASRSGLPVQDIVPVLTELAGDAGLESARILPRPETLDAEALTLRVTAVLRGDLESLRRLLLALAAMPFVQDMETLDITRPNQRLEFTLGLRLRLEDTRKGKGQTITNSRSGHAHDQA